MESPTALPTGPPGFPKKDHWRCHNHHTQYRFPCGPPPPHHWGHKRNHAAQETQAKQEYVTVRENREMCTEHSVYMEIKLWMALLIVVSALWQQYEHIFYFKHNCRKKNHFWAITYCEYSYHLRVLLALNGIVHPKITNAIIIYVWSSLFFGTQKIF